MLARTSLATQQEVSLEFAISNRIYELMNGAWLIQVAVCTGTGQTVPSEVTKWLSGQHNFTIRTLALLSAFFCISLVDVKK